MPVIPLKHVVSCSSEDKNFAADNLLKDDSFKKWKCATAGEKQATVIIQLEKPFKIQSIDIGNEGSAFVEVQVGRSADSGDAYQVLLVASCLMSPLESKSGSGTNRVRLFGPDQLAKSVAENKWDRVKIICTQPYNKSLQYGISFIKLHAPAEASTSDCVPGLTKFGSFKIKEEPETFTPGQFFAKLKTEKPPVEQNKPQLTGAAAVRAASAALGRELDLKRKLEQTDQDETPAAKKPAPLKRCPSSSSDSVELPKNFFRAGSSTPPGRGKSPLQGAAGPLPRSASFTRLKNLREKKSVPFESILNGVVFVLSGFVNPFRGQLRDKALEMGATYRPDWDAGCTHLVCAVANTPKFRQVDGLGGRIVSKEWILDSFKNTVRYPWKKYRLVDPTDSSDSEDLQRSPKTYRTGRGGTNKGANGGNSAPATSAVSSNQSHQTHQQAASSKPQGAASTSVQAEPTTGNIIYSDDDAYAGSTDVESDTDDEVKRFREQQQQQATNKKGESLITDDQIYNADTDVEEDKADKLPPLPDYLESKTFLLYGSCSAQTRKQLCRYITAFGGNLEDYMSEKVDFVIAMGKWDKNFDLALADNPRLTFIQPRWIFACSDQQKCVPYQSYALTPTGN